MLITITKYEYEKLLERDEFLCALEDAGVDNWEGYDLIFDDLPEQTPISKSQTKRIASQTKGDD